MGEARGRYLFYFRCFLSVMDEWKLRNEMKYIFISEDGERYDMFAQSGSSAANVTLNLPIEQVDPATAVGSHKT